MHHPTNRITHTTAFVTPVVEHWLERGNSSMGNNTNDTKIFHCCERCELQHELPPPTSDGEMSTGYVHVRTDRRPAGVHPSVYQLDTVDVENVFVFVHPEGVFSGRVSQNTAVVFPDDAQFVLVPGVQGRLARELGAAPLINYQVLQLILDVHQRCVIK